MWGATLRVLVAALALGSQAVEVKPYPRTGTAPWFEKYASEAKSSLRKFSPGAQVEMWITDDSFEQVVAFYRASGTERPGFAESFLANLKVRSGRDVKATYVTFDSTESPLQSRHYVSIQRPVIVSFDPLEVHDVTQIMLYRSK